MNVGGLRRERGCFCFLPEYGDGMVFLSGETFSKSLMAMIVHVRKEGKKKCSLVGNIVQTESFRLNHLIFLI